MNRRGFLVSAAFFGVLGSAGCSQIDEHLPRDDSATDSPLSDLASEFTDTESPSNQSPNPWGKDTLVIGLEQRVPARHDIREIVEEASRYWDENAETYSGYDISFRYRPNTDDPDILIILVEEIRQCGEHSGEVAGCAPLVVDRAPETAEVRIIDGYRKEWMVETLQHELGHTLGLGHDDEPAHLMSNQIEDRIPNYHDRREAIQLYRDAYDPFSSGQRRWADAMEAWSDQNYTAAEAGAVDAHNFWLEAGNNIDSAAVIVDDLNEETPFTLLEDAYWSVEYRRRAADSAIEMARAAQRRAWNAAEDYRTESNDHLEQARTYEFDNFEEFVIELGFPVGN